jgi:hypothetical protein
MPHPLTVRNFKPKKLTDGNDLYRFFTAMSVFLTGQLFVANRHVVKTTPMADAPYDTAQDRPANPVLARGLLIERNATHIEHL